ncbi:MBL fold metallo-hydrolase [Novosphingobium sp.]|uniref:MBL fold metallo-hydrolase n=1 Tax=Novosphingobium sp. TaxID=1874826 RepID=UPI0038B709EA
MQGFATLAKLALAGCAGVSMMATPVAARQASAPPQLFAERWIDGTQGVEPALQVQALDADTFVIRQSVKTNFEAPFLYLLFGKERALLLDTGAGNVAVRPTIDGLIARWLAAHGRAAIPLVVAHSHSHGDHVAGDAQFRNRPDTVVVGLAPADVASFFGIAHWPDQLGRLDLGGRMLTVIPTPGHQPAHIMIHDPQLGILLSGDALYPGRLYVPLDKFAVARASSDRLARFARGKRIRAALGAHIEMTTTPGRDYVQAAPTHPDEHRLELGPDAIGELQRGLHALPDGSKASQVHDHFIVFPVPPRPNGG